MRTKTLIGQDVTGITQDGYAIVYSGRIYTYGSYQWIFTRHNFSRGTSDNIWWTVNKKVIKIHTEAGDILWHVKAVASDADFIEYEILT